MIMAQCQVIAITTLLCAQAKTEEPPPYVAQQDRAYLETITREVTELGLTRTYMVEVYWPFQEL